MLRVVSVDTYVVVSIHVSVNREEASLTTGREHSAMDVFQEAAVRQIQGTDDITSNDLLLVVFTPVNVGPPGTSCAIENMCWFYSLKFFHHGFTILHSHSCSGNMFPLLLQKLLQVSSNPPFATPDEENVLRGILNTVCRHLGAKSQHTKGWLRWVYV